VLAVNTLSAPDRVALLDRGQVRLNDSAYLFGPHSITVLTFALDA
jgi:alpha-N-arabinofuranosidase